MRIAVINRSGGCFPDIIANGLSAMLIDEGCDVEIFPNAIPMLMRLLPLYKRPLHWRNKLHFRIRNKIKYYLSDLKLIRNLKKYDAVIICECLPNAYWKHYLDIESLKLIIQKPVLCYTDNIAASPLHRLNLLAPYDYNEDRYFLNLCLSNTVEIKTEHPKCVEIGLYLSSSGLIPVEKKEFCALIDFEQPGYESYRAQQIRVLQKLNIPFVVLEGSYTINEIRALYQKSALFFLAFPETFGLPIAECLSTGCKIFTPNSSWPMAWRLNAEPRPWGMGELPECFQVYETDEELEIALIEFKLKYHAVNTPIEIHDIFMKHYAHYYHGNRNALQLALEMIRRSIANYSLH